MACNSKSYFPKQPLSGTAERKQRNGGEAKWKKISEKADNVIATHVIIISIGSPVLYPSLAV